MAYELHMSDDDILRIAFIGDLEGPDLKGYLEAFASFLEAASEARPLLILADTNQAGKLSSKGRQAFTGLTKDPRIRKVAITGSSRYARVLTSFILKATGRDHIRLFNAEDEAVAWLKAE